MIKLILSEALTSNKLKTRFSADISRGSWRIPSITAKGNASQTPSLQIKNF
jgi:hypothetical protein